MKKQKLKNILIIGVFAVGMTLINNVVAHAAVTKYEDIPKGLNVQQLEAMSVKVSKEKNPEYYTRSNWEEGVYLMDVAKLPFDGKTYTDERKSSMADSHKTFIRLMEMTKGREVNTVNVKYGMTVVLNGQVNEGEPLSVEVTSAEKYNYLLAQENSTSKPETPKPNPTPEKPNPTPEAPLPNPTQKVVERAWGDNRIETSIAIAKKANESAKHNSVILAVASDFPDALTGGVLGKKYNAPIILVNKTASNSKLSLDYVVNNVEKNGTVILLGSTGVVDDSIYNHLLANGFKNIKRLGGSDRYATNIAIVNDLKPSKGTPIVVAYSLDFPDALSISPVATKNGYPIFISRKDMDKQTLEAIKNIQPSKIYIVGSSGVISSTTENMLKGITNNIVRLGGANRYETSVSIAEYFNTNSISVAIANAMDFPDALSGSYLAYKNDSSILVVNPYNTELQRNFIKKYNKSNIFILGGPGAVTDSTVDQLVK
ncbi:MAG: cell wall-binding repeat-containing protein [Clostridium celatum]|uniref:cell wall-binding repeat-containing protein n=1 Tax=Clostridium tertium TaxID=1559 RepID=UPI00290295D0|nr:cell wall-binding repeat-containing protein [Clostridium celatum]